MGRWQGQPENLLAAALLLALLPPTCVAPVSSSSVDSWADSAPSADSFSASFSSISLCGEVVGGEARRGGQWQPIAARVKRPAMVGPPAARWPSLAPPTLASSRACACACLSPSSASLAASAPAWAAVAASSSEVRASSAALSSSCAGGGGERRGSGVGEGCEEAIADWAPSCCKG